MTGQIFIEKKWLEATNVTFKEGLNSKGEKAKILTAQILPKGKISRNKVKYSQSESVKKSFIGISLNHNHVTEGSDNFPKGHWFEYFEDSEGNFHGRAEVYNKPYNKSYIEYLEAAGDNVKVSLQVSGQAEWVKSESKGSHRMCEITDWLETSTVNCEGFVDAKANLESVMCEMLQEEVTQENNKGENMKEDFFEELSNLREKYKISKWSKTKHYENVSKALVALNACINDTNDKEFFEDLKPICEKLMTIQTKLGKIEKPDKLGQDYNGVMAKSTY